MTSAALLSMAVAASWPGCAAAAKPANPCLDPQMVAQLLCPDLKMRKPFGLRIDALVRPRRLVLRAGDSIDNVSTRFRPVPVPPAGAEPTPGY